MSQLIDHHRRHIIELLEQGQDLPPDYKHLLFPPERQEYELVYAGKERKYDAFFQFLRDGNYEHFVSALDAVLGESGQG